MTMTVGSKVIYPSLGPCLISAVVNKVVAGTPVSFYQLTILDESGGELFVPVDKAEASGIRLLLEESEIPKLLGHLAKTVVAARDWKQRANDNTRKLSSGSAFDLVEVVESLSKLGETKVLSFREKRMLDKAKRLLVCEISEVMHETRLAAEEQVNRALKARTLAPVTEDPLLAATLAQGA